MQVMHVGKSIEVIVQEGGNFARISCEIFGDIKNLIWRREGRLGSGLGLVS